MNNADAPVVFCHGLFGWGKNELGGYPYFFSASRMSRNRHSEFPPFLFPATGPVSSLHDQACELFFQLKGGQVNYGKSHSETYGHLQYGRDYSGKALYGGWDEDHPLDFVAHSMGAPVVRMLQYLLETGFFMTENSLPYKTSSRWIRSLTSVAGVHNGSTLTWILGASEKTGLIQKNAWLVKILGALIERYARLQKKYTSVKDWYDFQLDQWGIQQGETTKESLLNLFAEPEFVESRDWALYDLTPNAMRQWNVLLTEYPGTWYFSYVTRSTIHFLAGTEIPLPFFTHWFLLPFALRIGCFRFSSGPERKSGIRFWHANDGMCPSISQDYPHEGRMAESVIVTRKNRKASGGNWRTGIWYVRKKMEKTDHAEVAMFPHRLRLRSGEKMYQEILETIESIRHIFKEEQ
jgi:hypothetical protein